MYNCLYCNKERKNTVDNYFCSQECSDKYDIAEEYEQIENDEVICPYCRLPQNDIADSNMYYDANDDEIECQFCDKVFILTADTHTTFTTIATEIEIEKEYERKRYGKDD